MTSLLLKLFGGYRVSWLAETYILLFDPDSL